MRKVLLTLFFVLSGCTSQTTLVVYSEPTGAYISEEITGTRVGITPVQISYNPQTLKPSNPQTLKQYKRSDGCYYANGLKAHWVSGSEFSYPEIKICGSLYGTYNITMSRNMSDKNLDKDMEFALKVQNLSIQQQQANAASAAAAAAMWDNAANFQSNLKQVNNPQPINVNCTSTSAGVVTSIQCQ